MRHKISIYNSIDELHKLVETVEKLQSEWKFTDSLGFRINLCLEELFTNIVFYGNKINSTTNFLFEQTTNEIKIEIRDNGLEFNPLKNDISDIENKTLEEREIGGLGILLIQNSSDFYSYSRENGININTLKFNK